MGMWRTRWAAIGAATAVSLGGGGIGLVSAGISTGERPVTVTVEPTRILDTRVDLGLAGRFVNESPRDLQVTGNVPIAPSGTATVVPGDAVAVLVNVTVVAPDSNGFLSLRPGGAAGTPTTSTVNFAAGAVEPNAATVDLGPGGTMQVFLKTASPTGTAHVLVDVVGYTIDHDHDDRYYTESEVDALIAGVGGSDYQNVIVVAKSGGHFTSVTAAMNAIGSDPDYPAASTSNRYLVFVGPGVYENEDVDMQPYVDIEGSGQGVTVLRSVGGTGGLSPDSATLVGADDAELRHVTVEIEAAAAGNWTHAIYTATGTSFQNVTARSTGGSRTRGIVVATGGRAVMIDVIMVANGGSVSNLGLDLFGGVVYGDGLFADVTGGDVATGIFLNSASDEVLIENVTTLASGGNTGSNGVELTGSSATIEGLRSIVIGEATTHGVLCTGAGTTVRMLEATVYSENTAPTGNATGLRATDCDFEVRNAVVDAVAAGGQAFGVYHFQTNTVTPANLTISDVESRAESGDSSAYGLLVNSGGASAAGTFGRVTELNTRATGGNESVNSWGIRHSANGEVQYRGLSIIVGGPTNFMYGIQTDGDGVPRFDDVVIDAIGEAEATVFGVEFLTDGSTLTNARVSAINYDTGSFHDAVGIKANGASGVTFVDVTAYAEGETNIWGADLVGSETRLVGVDARAISTVDGVALGVRCAGGSSSIHDSLFRAESAVSTSYGFNSDVCDSTVTDTEMVAAGSGANYGVYANSTGTNTTSVRGSFISGSSSSVRTVGTGAAEVYVVGSQLDGGAGSTFGTSDVQECTAVTYNSGGSETFQSTTSDPCP